MASNKSMELAPPREADGITRLFEAPKWPGATPELRSEFVDGKKNGGYNSGWGKCGWLDFVGADFWELCWMKKGAGLYQYILIFQFPIYLEPTSQLPIYRVTRLGPWF